MNTKEKKWERGGKMLSIWEGDLEYRQLGWRERIMKGKNGREMVESMTQCPKPVGEFLSGDNRTNGKYKEEVLFREDDA